MGAIVDLLEGKGRRKETDEPFSYISFCTYLSPRGDGSRGQEIDLSGTYRRYAV